MFGTGVQETSSLWLGYRSPQCASKFTRNAEKSIPKVSHWADEDGRYFTHQGGASFGLTRQGKVMPGENMPEESFRAFRARRTGICMMSRSRISARKAHPSFFPVGTVLLKLSWETQQLPSRKCEKADGLQACKMLVVQKTIRVTDHSGLWTRLSEKRSATTSSHFWLAARKS